MGIAYFMRRQLRVLAVFCLSLLLAACDGTVSTTDEARNGAQPLNVAQLRELGSEVYQANCASCHGFAAQGAAEWRRRDAQGRFPPPPLNGSGHAWHHPRAVLKSVILDGSPGGQGNMPAWRGKLTEQEIDAVILWFQSLWPQPIYDAWLDIQQRNN